MLKLGNLTLAATAVSLAMASGANAGVQEDRAMCQERAQAITKGMVQERTTERAINTGAHILGSVLTGRKPSYAIESGTRSTINGAAWGAQAKARKQKYEFDECMRQANTEQRKVQQQRLVKGR